MKVTYFECPEACAYLETHRESFPFQMTTRLSSVTLGNAEYPVDLTEVLEARYFGPEGEMRFYDDGAGRKAALFSEGEGDPFLDQTSPLIPGFGENLTSRRCIGFDEDGQGYVEFVRLVDWKGGKTDGQSSAGTL
jgi:hypothetical protein